MSPRICICCGELRTDSETNLSRNPNLCASCSSLMDGMDTPAVWQMESQNGSDYFDIEEVRHYERHAMVAATNGKALELAHLHA